MKIKASCGNAPASESLDTSVYSITLTAQSIGERRWLAGMLKAIGDVSEYDNRLTGKVPRISIHTRFAE